MAKWNVPEKNKNDEKFKNHKRASTSNRGKDRESERERDSKRSQLCERTYKSLWHNSRLTRGLADCLLHTHTTTQTYRGGHEGQADSLSGERERQREQRVVFQLKHRLLTTISIICTDTDSDVECLVVVIVILVVVCGGLYGTRQSLNELDSWRDCWLLSQLYSVTIVYKTVWMAITERT